MRLIDGDALYEKVSDLEAQAIDYIVKIPNKTENWIMWNAILAERSAFRHDVYDAPTIEPERKTGQWVSVGCVVPDIANVPMIKCTVCGHLEPDVDVARTPYCSHCGARMEGDAE